MDSIENAFKKLDERDTSAIQKHIEILTKTLHDSTADPRIHWEETLNVLTELWNRYQKRLLEIKKAEIDTIRLSRDTVNLQRELEELRKNNAATTQNLFRALADKSCRLSPSSPTSSSWFF